MEPFELSRRPQARIQGVGRHGGGSFTGMKGPGESIV